MNGFQCLFRSLSDKSAILCRICLDKPISASGINVTLDAQSYTYSDFNVGTINTNAVVANKSVTVHYIQFSVTTSNTISSNQASGVAELNATITFT